MRCCSTPSSPLASWSACRCTPPAPCSRASSEGGGRGQRSGCGPLAAVVPAPSAGGWQSCACVQAPLLPQYLLAAAAGRHHGGARLSPETLHRLLPPTMQVVRPQVGPRRPLCRGRRAAGGRGAEDAGGAAVGRPGGRLRGTMQLHLQLRCFRWLRPSAFRYYCCLPPTRWTWPTPTARTATPPARPGRPAGSAKRRARRPPPRCPLRAVLGCATAPQPLHKNERCVTPPLPECRVHDWRPGPARALHQSMWQVW